MISREGAKTPSSQAAVTYYLHTGDLSAPIR